MYRVLILTVLLIAGGKVSAEELPDCGPLPENTFVDPMAIHLLLDLDATPALVEQLTENFPSIAFHIATLKGMWFCNDGGVTAAFAPDLRSHHAFSVNIVSKEDVKLLVEEGPGALPAGPAPIASSGEPWYWTELAVSRLPDNEIHLMATLTAAKSDGASHQILGVLGVVRLRLKLKKDDTYRLAGVDGVYVDVYEIAEILETMPEQQLEVDLDSGDALDQD